MPKAIGDIKQCSRCKEFKHVSEFHKNKRQSDGFDNSCKSCRLIYYKNNKEERLKYHEMYLINNKEKIKKKNKIYQEKHKEKYKIYYKQYHKKNRDALIKYMIKYHANKKAEKAFIAGFNLMSLLNDETNSPLSD